jgi:prepilin-type processing-associated H-X9-DG protein
MSTLLAYLIVAFSWCPVLATAVLAFLVVAVLTILLSLRKWGASATATGTLIGLWVGTAGVIAWASMQPMGHLPPLGLAAVNSLELISQRIAVYAAFNGGQLPLSLGAIASDSSEGGSLPVVRGSGTPEARSGTEPDDGQGDFLYFGEGSLDREDADEVVVATTKPSMFGSEGYVCVLYLDGHVETHRTVPEHIRRLWEACPNGKPAGPAPSDESVRSDRSD